MRLRAVFRAAALAIALAGLVDPAIARREPAPLSVELRLPPASHPDFQRAQELRDQIVRSLARRASFDGRTSPQAVVALGNANVRDAGRARVFAMPLPARRPDISITGIEVPRQTAPGQSVVVAVSVRGVGATGRLSTINVELRGLVVASVQHSWTADDERFDATLAFAPPGPGVHRIRVAVSTDGAGAAPVADAAVLARDAPVRVLVYESRPSWPVTFVRRSLEADPMFEVASTVRSSRPAATISREAPAFVSRLDADRYDAVVIGALEGLRDADFSALDGFVSLRGGTLILLPDRQVPAAVLRRFQLPELDEVLLEKPLEVRGNGVSVRASELLLVRSPGVALQSLGLVQQGNTERVAIAAMDRGEGRLVLAGVLDAWRYRADGSSGFDGSWRGLIADAALDAPPKLDVQVEPAIARPGDTVNVSVVVRQTELRRHGQTLSVPRVTASLVGGDGRRDHIRLWPAAPVGRYEAGLVAPAAGRYNISASIPGAGTNVPLLVDDDVVHAIDGVSRAPEHAARATGGAVVKDAGELTRALEALDTGTQDLSSRPMRSSWWIVPFALLLCAEWGLRRRHGLT